MAGVRVDSFVLSLVEGMLWELGKTSLRVCLDITTQLLFSSSSFSRSSSKRFAEQTAAIVALLVLGVQLPLIRPS